MEEGRHIFMFVGSRIFTKDVYRRNAINKNYWKNLIVLFIWLIGFPGAGNYFYTKSHWHSNFKLFTKNF